MPQATFKGNPITLCGPELKAGDAAPDFKCVNSSLEEVSLADSKGTTRVISVTPSLDTPVCEQQAKKFNEAAAKLENVQVINVSMDLPFAQKRFCATHNIEKLQVLSDFRERSFGQHYGILITDGPVQGLLMRAIFVIGPDDKIRYVEHVSELADEPDYEQALAAASA